MATKTMTAYGNAQIDTAQKKFGTASGLFDGTGDYIDTPAHEDFNIGSADFTIDFWLKRNTFGTNQRICGQGGGAGGTAQSAFFIRLNSNNTLSTFIFVDSSQVHMTTNLSIADSGWHHVALVGSGTTKTLYCDGVSAASLSVETVNNSTDKLAIGRFGEYAYDYFNGWIDEFRFSKGIARYTSNFTPPIAPHTADAYTVLLLHMDGADGSTNFIDDSASVGPSAPQLSAKIGGAWKNYSAGHVKINGVWRPIESIHTKIDGTWKRA